MHASRASARIGRAQAPCMGAVRKISNQVPGTGRGSPGRPRAAVAEPGCPWIALGSPVGAQRAQSQPRARAVLSARLGAAQGP
jgi:hypothetical protein